MILAGQSLNFNQVLFSLFVHNTKTKVLYLYWHLDDDIQRNVNNTTCSPLSEVLPVTTYSSMLSAEIEVHKLINIYIMPHGIDQTLFIQLNTSLSV